MWVYEMGGGCVNHIICTAVSYGSLLTRHIRPLEAPLSQIYNGAAVVNILCYMFSDYTIHQARKDTCMSECGNVCQAVRQSRAGQLEKENGMS